MRLTQTRLRLDGRHQLWSDMFKECGTLVDCVFHATLVITNKSNNKSWHGNLNHFRMLGSHQYDSVTSADIRYP